MNFVDTFRQTIQRRVHRHLNNAKIFLLALKVASFAKADPDKKPILFFKASSGIDDLSWNSAFQLLTSWGLRLRGVPVRFFACSSGMDLCVLGTDRDDPAKNPPCATCIYQSKTLYAAAPVTWFQFKADPSLDKALEDCNLSELIQFEFANIPLGQLVLPAARWILRRHNLVDNPQTRLLFRRYIRSAYSVIQEFENELKRQTPHAVVVFNGQFYPEAAVKWAARKHGIRVISHEVGLRPMTGFFTEGESTAYPIEIPSDFQLNRSQNALMDAYLAKRFQGDFSMGGVRFWQEIKHFDQTLETKIAKFNKLVPVFTNVVFDTSQPHANTLFTDMFAWLEEIIAQAARTPDTLFVLRAHPDETRIRKASLETVENWIISNQVTEMHNVHFIPPNEFISSYELIQRSNFVLIYNSTIGMEAVLMGKYVLCAGKARFTQLPIVEFPESKVEYINILRQRLNGDIPEVRVENIQNARKFLFYQLFRSSLPFEHLKPSIRGTHASLCWFDVDSLREDKTISVIYQGLFEGGDFLLYEDGDSLNDYRL